MGFYTKQFDHYADTGPDLTPEQLRYPPGEEPDLDADDPEPWDDIKGICGFDVHDIWTDEELAAEEGDKDEYGAAPERPRKKPRRSARKRRPKRTKKRATRRATTKKATTKKRARSPASTRKPKQIKKK